MAGTLFLNSIARAEALGTAIHYVGQLDDAGAHVKAAVGLRYELYTSDVQGGKVGETVTKLAMPVFNGVFTSEVDFGPNVFSGEIRWLELPCALRGPATIRYSARVGNRDLFPTRSMRPRQPPLLPRRPTQ